MAALGTTLGLVSVGALVDAAAAADPQLQCFTSDAVLIKTQPIYTGASAQYVQSAFVPATPQTARWSEYESLAMKAKWSEASRVPTAAELNATQPSAGATWYVPASPTPGQPPQAYVPVQVQGQAQPLTTAAPPPQQVAAVPLSPSPGAAVPAGPVPQTNPDANAPPGATGCNGEKIDQTTADAARRAFEVVGFQGVRDLRKGCDNVWHAHARLNNKASYVMLNPQGDIYIEKNP